MVSNPVTTIPGKCVFRSCLADSSHFWILQSTFDGSPKCPVRAWVEEIDNFVQQHQFSEIEAIKVAALYFEGKAYDWWLFEYFSLKNENTPTYARFIARLIERFYEAPCVTSSVDTIQPYQPNILHDLGGSMNPNPFLKTWNKV